MYGVDFAFFFVGDPGLDDVGGEDVAFEEERVVGFERGEGFVQRSGDLGDLGEFFGREVVEVAVDGRGRFGVVLDAAEAGDEHR